MGLIRWLEYSSRPDQPHRVDRTISGGQQHDSQQHNDEVADEELLEKVDRPIGDEQSDCQQHKLRNEQSDCQQHRREAVLRAIQQRQLEDLQCKEARAMLQDAAVAAQAERPAPAARAAVAGSGGGAPAQEARRAARLAVALPRRPSRWGSPSSRRRACASLHPCVPPFSPSILLPAQFSTQQHVAFAAEPDAPPSSLHSPPPLW